jgi:hypothetical protein
MLLLSNLVIEFFSVQWIKIAMQYLWLQILVFTSSFIIIYCDQESMVCIFQLPVWCFRSISIKTYFFLSSLKLIQQYPAEYEQYIQSITEQNKIEGSGVNEKLSDDESHAGPASNFVQWLQILLGITTTTPVSTSPAKPPIDCEPCTVCGRAVNGTKIVGKNF